MGKQDEKAGVKLIFSKVTNFVKSSTHDPVMNRMQSPK